MMIMIYFLMIIVLYGSQIEKEQKLYTGVELTKDYPWLFDETREKPKAEEKSIYIKHCRFESKSVFWPAHDLFNFLFYSVTLEDSFNLSRIPFITNLFFHSLDHNDPEILKKCKFPPIITNLNFGKDAVQFIKFIRAENFAKKVDRVDIHKESFKKLSKHDSEKVAKKLGTLLKINPIHMINNMEDDGEFFNVNVKHYHSVGDVPFSEEKKLIPQVNCEIKVYNGIMIREEYPWLYTNEYPWLSTDKTIHLSDGRMESKTIIWPPMSLFMLHLSDLTLVDPFNFATIPKIEFLTLQNLDSNRAQILKNCIFPRAIFELRFDEHAVKMINYIEPKNFADSVMFIKIHIPTWRNFHDYERIKMFKKVAELINITEEKLKKSGVINEVDNFYSIDVQKHRHQEDALAAQKTNDVSSVPILSEKNIEFISDGKNNIKLSTGETAQTTNSEIGTSIVPILNVQNLNEQTFKFKLDSKGNNYIELSTFDLRTNDTSNLTFYGSELRTTSFFWPDQPMCTLNFNGIIFLNALDLSSIPYIERLNFCETKGSSSDILQQIKLPAAVETLSFGKDSLQMIDFLQFEFFPEYVGYVTLNQNSFVTLQVEQQDCLLNNLCKLLTHSTVNLNYCVQYMKESYFETTKNGVFLIDVAELRPKNSKKFIFLKKDITTTGIMNLTYADEIAFADLELNTKAVIWPTATIFSIIFQHVSFTEPFDLSSIAFVTTLTLHHIDHNPYKFLTQSKFPKKLHSLTLQEDALSIITAVAPENFASGVSIVFIHRKSFQTMHRSDQQKFVEKLIQLVCTDSLDEKYRRMCPKKVKQSIYENKKELFFGLIRIALLE